MFLGLLLVALPLFALANTSPVIENAIITTEDVVVEASSEVLGTAVEMQTDEYENWICYGYTIEVEITLTLEIEGIDIIIQGYAYYEEWWCIFW